MEATYICHWIKRRVMGATDIHLSNLYDTGTRKKRIMFLRLLSLEFYIKSLEL